MLKFAKKEKPKLNMSDIEKVKAIKTINGRRF